MADDTDAGREDEGDRPVPTREEPDLSAAEIRLLDALWDRRHRVQSARPPRRRPRRGRA